MTFLDEIILATLNEWQGATLTAEQVASIINISDVSRVRASLEMLTESHRPVVKTDEGYTIPTNNLSEYISGIAIFTAILSLGLLI